MQDDYDGGDEEEGGGDEGVVTVSPCSTLIGGSDLLSVTPLGGGKAQPMADGAEEVEEEGENKGGK